MEPKFYQGDLTKLSDSELKQFSNELCDAGVTSIDPYYYDEGDWIRQANDHYEDIRKELNRRWELANPEEVIKRKESGRAMATLLNAQIDHVRPKLLEMFEKSQQISKLIRGK